MDFVSILSFRPAFFGTNDLSKIASEDLPNALFEWLGGGMFCSCCCGSFAAFDCRGRSRAQWQLPSKL
jgi:transposase